MADYAAPLGGTPRFGTNPATQLTEKEKSIVREQMEHARKLRKEALLPIAASIDGVEV